MSEYRVDWKGTFVPSVTPFDKDGTFLEDHFRKVLEHLIADGVSGIIVAGCTGEWFSMSDTERRRLFEIAVEQIDGRVKVIAGTCAISTHETVALTRAAKDIGCDGCMIMSPHFIAVNEDEVIYHYAEVGKVGLPIMLYTLPVRLSYNLDAPVIERLLEIDAVVAIKDSSLDARTFCHFWVDWNNCIGSSGLLLNRKIFVNLFFDCLNSGILRNH